jgi:peptidylprolyl isomerase
MQTKLIAIGILLAGLVVAVIIAASGGGDDDDAEAGGSAALTEDTDLRSKPSIEVPGDSPPAELEVTDIVEGDGAEATTGDTVSVEYVGVTYADGTEFDASWGPGEPFEFELGSGSVIPGWDEGIPGMKVGGRRQLVIPPEQAYGAEGFPPDIGPNETLVFVVDLVDVR